jgi:CheY-like chemotaxis protein
VGEVAREALSLLRAALPSAIDIRCEVKTPMDLVNADATQLHQIFMNLGANAGHAIGHRPGQLVVTVERCHLKTSRLFLTRSLLPGEYICISVSDTGCGMSAEVMSRVFDPFFSTKPVDQGTGLGLAVVHGIVSDHGGAIEVESQVGQGTCFRILLPAANTSPLERPAEASPVLHGNERILLVDDEELVLSVVTIHLQRLGFHVTAQATSGGALECFKASPSSFDAVITDQTMPQMSGLELTAELKRVRPDIPVILATGYSAETGEKEAAVFGLAGIIGKPIDFAELTSLIRDALDRKESTSLERVMG